MTQKNTRRGFTLIELLVVILIIGILAAVALPQYNTAVERSRATEALTLMSAVASSAERYHAQRERWPSDFNQLDADIPMRPAPNNDQYGGKHFQITLPSTTPSPSANFVITARRDRDSHAYVLRTTVIPNNTNGTYAAVRTCTISSTGDDSEAQGYCNAIAGSATEAATGF